MAEAKFDLVIRGGQVADGSGAEIRQADVGIVGARIAAVGRNLDAGREEIDARGLLVTPGFVDIHTHYDGHVTWENRMRPSNDHGVTTVVTGSCGVGFAPCWPEHRDELISLMAGVEDIPEVVMAEGLPWTWRTFPEYLDVVARTPHDVDVAAMLPHSALRVYVMRERAVAREPATDADRAAMAELTREAMRAGAIGFATSRAIQHKSARGEPIPTIGAPENELLSVLSAMSESGAGMFQALSDFGQFGQVDEEFAMFRRLVAATGRPLSFTLNQKHRDPDGWRRLLALTEAANDEGLPIKGQVLGRPTGVLLGLELSLNPFSHCPLYERLGKLPLPARLAELARPEIRQQIMAETEATNHRGAARSVRDWSRMFELGDGADYEQPEEASIAGRARALGVKPEELAYDLLLQEDGRQVLLLAYQNYAGYSLDPSYEMMTHRDTILGLGDAGAHAGLICDGSYPTTMLAHWTRDRRRGPRIPLAECVRWLSADTAAAAGLNDRGRIAPGYKADLNVIDYDGLRLHPPRASFDLPTGGRRISQRADGYVATLLSGTVTYRNGEPTDVLPGRLVRGVQPAPTAAATA